MSTKKNSPEIADEYPEPVTGRHFVPVGRAADNDHDMRKRAHPAQPMTQVVHPAHPYVYRDPHGKNHSFGGSK
jgi:hypothetical protein